MTAELTTLLTHLREVYHLIPFIGLEIEWILISEDGQPATDTIRCEFLVQFTEACATLPIHSIDVEEGKGQVEAALLHTFNIVQLLHNVKALKTYAEDVAISLNLTACFAAKPFRDDYGNGLHIHLHLENIAGELLYWKRDGVLSPALNASIAGLLHTMHTYLLIFAGSDVAYGRYVSGYNAPTTVSWGMNNRTTALRIPDGLGLIQGVDDVLRNTPTPYKRIEHRVASSEASVEAVVVAILCGIEDGFAHPRPLPPAIYGDASHTDYACELLIV